MQFVSCHHRKAVARRSLRLLLGASSKLRVVVLPRKSWRIIQFGNIPPECFKKVETLTGELLQERPPQTSFETRRDEFAPHRLHHAAEGNLSQAPLRTNLWGAILTDIEDLCYSVKQISLSPGAETLAERLQEAGQAVRQKSAAEVSAPGNVVLLELLNIEHFITCSTCGNNKRPSTTCCSCGEIMPDIEHEVKSQVWRDTKEHIDNHMLTLKERIPEDNWSLREAERETAPQSRKRDIRRVRTGNAADK